ncbi:hypothetical protein ACP70R_025184 [Stipagrostis hirtigluma subsp. patula]
MEDLPRVLPYDVLADVLARLRHAPRCLAAARCVCREWRAAVDDQRLLRADLLPLAVGGIFVTLYEPEPPVFFAPPSMAAKIHGRFEKYVEMESDFDTPDIVSCCNGLILLDYHVVNPATRQWVSLPPYPGVTKGALSSYGAYLAFDPMMSPHYEVLLVPDYPKKGFKGSEWPPLVYMICVYSSETRRWEERPFAREGGPAGTVSDVMLASEPNYRHAIYWRGALYVHCRSDFITRIILSDDKFQVIKLPTGINARSHRQIHLGKSKHGVCFASVDNQCRLQVRFLNEFCGEMEWVLKHDINLQVLVHYCFHSNYNETNRPWILQDDKYDQENTKGRIVTNNLDWDSEEDNAVDVEDRGEESAHIQIFGFHPFKEIIYMEISAARVVAYYLNSSRVQDLGKLRLQFPGHPVETGFIYTPCWTGELSANN